MANYIKLEMEDNRAIFLNVDLIRAVYVEPREDSVRVEFDSNHHIYLGQDRAEVLLKALE